MTAGSSAELAATDEQMAVEGDPFIPAQAENPVREFVAPGQRP